MQRLYPLATIEKILLLKSMPLFQVLGSEDLLRLATICEEEYYTQGVRIFTEKEVGSKLYCIVRGQVRIHHDEENVAMLKEGEVFGEMAILDATTRSASATTETDIVLLSIKREDFQELLLARSTIAVGLIKVLSQRLRNLLHHE